METPHEEDWSPTVNRDEGHSKKMGGLNIQRVFQLPHADHWHSSNGHYFLNIIRFCNAVKTVTDER